MNVVRCRDIEAVLSRYVMDELEPARARVVSRHIEKCERCRAAERDVRAALGMLRLAVRETRSVPCRLDRERLEQILRARNHPLVRWTERPMVLLAVTIAVATALNIGFLIQRRVRVKPIEPWEPIEVRVRRAPPAIRMRPGAANPTEATNRVGAVKGGAGEGGGTE